MGKKNEATATAEAPRGRRGKPQSAREALGPMEPAASDRVVNAQDRLIEAAKAEVCKLLDKHADEIMIAYREAVDMHNEADSDKKFTFKVPVSIGITGVDPDTYEVSAKIAFSVKRTDTTTALVKTGKDLVDMMEQGE